MRQRRPMAASGRTWHEVGLSAANRAAPESVRERAQRAQPRHVARIERVLAAAAVEADPGALLAAAGRQGVLTVNFHPDRLLADGRTVAEALDRDGVYRSQFETSISNGGLTAYAGGARDLWERGLFAGAYHRSEVGAAERPRYGGLNLMNHRNGACPRFGSCHVELRPEAAARATLIFGDSAAGPTDVGLADAFAPVLAPLLETLAATGGALGRSSLAVRGFAEGLLHGDAAARRGIFAPAMTRTLNDYVEAQIHGVVSLTADVDAVVLDPSFAGTPEHDRLRAAAERHGFALRRHAGSALPLADVPRDVPDTAGAEPMRWQRLCGGGRARRLAERVVADHGAARRLDAATIGRAAVSAVR